MLAWARKHRLPAALIALLVVCLAAEGALWVRLSRLRAQEQRARGQLREIQNMATEYEELTERAARANQTLQDPEAFDIRAVTRIAARENVRERIDGSPEASSGPAEDGVLERTVELDMVGLSHKALVRFLQATEGLDPAVRTTKLRITPNEEVPQLIDAEITLSARAASPSVGR